MYIKVRVVAGAKKEDFKRKDENTFLISVKEKAERNMANRRVCELISLFFKVPINKVHIVNGHQSPSKILSVDL